MLATRPPGAGEPWSHHGWRHGAAPSARGPTWRGPRPAYAVPVRWWQRVSAWDDDHRLAVDTATAALFALLTVPLRLGMLGADWTTGTSTPAALWPVAMCVALVWRRVRPEASAAGVYGLALLHVLLDDPIIFPADGLVLVSLYSVTMHGAVWAYRAAIAATVLGSFVAVVRSLPQLQVEGAFVFFVGMVLLALAVFAFGLVRRARREKIDALVDRARRLEVERDQQARIATAAERARIAREMHDIVAHSLSVIIAQADGGRYAATADPRAAERSLATIAETGRAALADMRRLLGVLRTDRPDGAEDDGAGTGTGTSGPVDLTPQPAVADIAGLVEQVRGSGVTVSFVTVGDPRPLPPGTGLTVYRICQESLTNVLKHAGPDAHAHVLLRWDATSLVLEVADDGRGAAAESDGQGQGVLGMRERAAMLGGTLTVGPRPGGGYRVRAEVPVPPVDPQRQQDHSQEHRP